MDLGDFMLAVSEGIHEKLSAQGFDRVKSKTIFNPNTDPVTAEMLVSFKKTGKKYQKVRVRFEVEE